jgi:DNA-binding response OmpR family regulator
VAEPGGMTLQGKRAPRRVLVVDDDPHVLALLSRVLDREGFEVTGVTTAAEALDRINGSPPEVVLLDVNLAGRDGFDVFAEVRQAHDLPVIFVTGRGAEPDRVLGLRMGADDYVVKPFSPQELIARINNILRRRDPPPRAHVRTFGALTLDTVSREVRLDGELVITTAKEFDLLAFMSASPRQVFTREQLLQHVWNSSGEWQDMATVTEHVRRLRQKIEARADRPRWITTVRGIGYRFEP